MSRKVNAPKNLKSASTPRAAAATVKKGKVVKSTKDAKPPKEAKAKADKKESKPATKGAATAKEAPPKKKRSKSGVVRLKAYWGVFNQMMKRTHLFEHAEKRQADKKAAELTAGSKSPHFVQLVKEVIRDAD